MLRFLKQSAKDLLNSYPDRDFRKEIAFKFIGNVCQKEFELQSFERFNERPVELGFLFVKLRELYPRTVLDVGTGTTALPHLMRNCGFLVTASDNVRDYWPSGMLNRHYHVVDDDITDTRLSGKFDLITCISVLEHIRKPDDAMRNMFSLLAPGGHLILTFPYNERNYVENVYELPGSSYGQGAQFITQSYSRTELDRWLRDNHAKVLDQEYWQFWAGDHWTVGEQIIPPRRVTAEDKHQLTCVLIRKD